MATPASASAAPATAAPPATGQAHPPPPALARQAAALQLTPSAVSDGVHVIDGPHGRILCIADVRGKLSLLNQLAAETQADAVIHTGDFAFYEPSSLERISDRTLRHLVQYSPLIADHERSRLLGLEGGSGPLANTALRTAVAQQGTATLLSEFPQLLSGQLQLKVPVFTVWGACEDVEVLEKFRTGEYSVPNLHVLDEATTRAIEVGGVRLRLLGLGGTVVMHKLFDNGLGNATIAGGQGTMWTTLLQIGELIDTAQKVYDASETRLLLTHVAPGREGLLALLAIALRADLTISAGLHFRYAVSYNEFNVQHDPENFRAKLIASRNAFYEVWDTVKAKVEEVIDDHQRVLLRNALAVINRIPGGPSPSQGGGHAHPSAAEEATWKNIWNWNLPDAAHGSLVLDVHQGRISATTKSQGFNFAYRRAGHAASKPLAPSQPAAAPAQTAKPASLPAAPSSVPKQPPARGPAPWERTPANLAAASAGSAAAAAAARTAPAPAAGSAAPRAPAPGTEQILTLHMAGLTSALPVNQDAILSYFPAAIAKEITEVSLPSHNARGSRGGAGDTDTEAKGGAQGQKPFAYVSFSSESALQAALQHGSTRPALVTPEGRSCTPTLARALKPKREPRSLSGDGGRGKKPENNKKEDRKKDKKEDKKKAASLQGTDVDTADERERRPRGGKGKKKQEDKKEFAPVKDAKPSPVDKKGDKKSKDATKPEVKETKPEPKAEAKDQKPPAAKEVKQETKTEPKPEVKPEPKESSKPEAKSEPKAEAKPEPKPEPKVEAKSEAKTETTPEPKAEPKTDVKTESKPEPKTEAKAAEPQAEAKTE